MSVCLPAAVGETLVYELTPRFDAAVLHVDLTWTTGGRRTASALRVAERVGPIEDVPQLLHNLAVSASNQRQNAVWIVKHRPGEILRCTYDVVAGRRAFEQWSDKHYPVVAPTFFHGLGSAFLLAPAAYTGVPDDFEVIVRWQLPAGYKAACSWGLGRTVGARISADNLRQSVYLAGKIATTTRQQGDRRVSLAVVDRFGFTLDEFADMTAAVIKHQCDFMGETDFPSFVITAIPAGPPLKSGEARIAGSGLYNSFALFVAPGSQLDDAVEHLFAHELFHHWCGRLLRAKQPERQAYWFIEGVTDYYSLRILYDYERWRPAVYAKWINQHVREYHLNPAIHASNDDIERDYWIKRATVGEVAYQRGLLLGLRWHKLARSRGVPNGFDKLFKSLVNRAREGYYEISNAEIRKSGVDLLGPWFAREFDQYVIQAKTIPLPPDVLAPKLAGKMTDVYAYEVGFDQQRSLKEQRVRGLIPGAAAAKAGLREGDRLTGWRLPGNPNTQVKLHILRKGGEKTITYYPRGTKKTVVQFSQ